MNITEVRIKLVQDSNERLLAFCSITFDSCFVVRDLKIIEGARGTFVSMPGRKLMDRCPLCGSKNHLRALYCNGCGARLKEDRARRGEGGKPKLFADLAHPINCRCRDSIQERVLVAYQEERLRAQMPGYVCRYDEDDEDALASLYQSVPTERQPASRREAMRNASAFGAGIFDDPPPMTTPV